VKEYPDGSRYNSFDICLDTLAVLQPIIFQPPIHHYHSLTILSSELMEPLCYFISWFSCTDTLFILPHILDILYSMHFTWFSFR